MDGSCVGGWVWVGVDGSCVGVCVGVGGSCVWVGVDGQLCVCGWLVICVDDWSWVVS